MSGDPGVISLMYHYVRPDDTSRLRHLQLDDFSRQLDYFESRFGRILSGDDWARAKAGEQVTGVLLTFDDGLKDHINHVLPVLTSRNLFGLFFVCTDPMEHGLALNVHIVHKLLSIMPSRELLTKLLKQLPPEALHEAQGELASSAYLNQTDEEATKLVKRIINFVSTRHGQRNLLDEVWSELIEIRQSDFVSEWYLSIADVKTLANSGMGIGSHTCSHNLLSNVADDKLRFELRNSKNFLEEVTQEQVTEFCYPFGGKLSYNKNTLEELSKAGFTVAHSVESRRVMPHDFTNPLELPRYDCNEFPFGTARSPDLS